MPKLTIAVSSPNFWWRTNGTGLTDDVLYDPDRLAGRIQWYPYIPWWNEVASVLVDVGDRLAAGHYQLDGDGHAMVRVEDPGLNNVSEAVVRSWFDDHEAVTLDPWSQDIPNGRRRLWWSLHATPSSLGLPVRSHALATNTNRPWSPELAEPYSEHLNQLRQAKHFNAQDPLNARFLAALWTAATSTQPLPA